MEPRVPVVLGQATGEAQALPIGADAITAARTVRRALAAAHRHAVEVNALVVATDEEQDEDRLRAFARRALGPAGDDVALSSLTFAEQDPARLANLAMRRLAPPPDAARPIAVTLGIGREGALVALCAGWVSRRRR